MKKYDISKFPEDDNMLVKNAKKDPRAFSELYNRYIERIFKYLCSKTGNVTEAEDITSQTFLIAFESLHRYRQEGPFSSWLFSIAKNKAMDHFRKKKNCISFDEALELYEQEDPLGGIIISEKMNALKKLIFELSAEERELLRLRFFAEMSFPEIAHLLERNEDAVKKSFYRLLSRLHDQLEVIHE
jgi:RNA polymerase sigma-70 factor (ECF subfamily)